MGSTQASTLKPQYVNDLKNTTAFSHTEINDLYRQFKFDCKDSGQQMTLEAFTKMYQDVFPSGDANAFAANIFKAYDLEGNGKINFRQFISTLSIQLKGNLQEKLEWAFDVYDIEKNGYISHEDVMEMISSMEKLRANVLPISDRVPTSQITDYIFEGAGVAKDGKISKTQFLTAAITSKTIQKIIEGTTSAASSPYTDRKERSGSFGKPRSSSFN